MITTTTKPRYMFCWWCSRQLWGKRLHATMRPTGANENAPPVTVHRACGEQMEREGEWTSVADEDAA